MPPHSTTFRAHIATCLHLVHPTTPHFPSNPPSRNWPRIIAVTNSACTDCEESKDSLMIEHMSICEVSFAIGLLLWFAAHYIFNLAFCPQHTLVCCFMQEVVFQIPQDEDKMSDKTCMYNVRFNGIGRNFVVEVLRKP